MYTLVQKLPWQLGLLLGDTLTYFSSKIPTSSDVRSVWYENVGKILRRSEGAGFNENWSFSSRDSHSNSCIYIYMYMIMVMRKVWKIRGLPTRSSPLYEQQAHWNRKWACHASICTREIEPIRRNQGIIIRRLRDKIYSHVTADIDVREIKIFGSLLYPKLIGQHRYLWANSREFEQLSQINWECIWGFGHLFWRYI